MYLWAALFAGLVVWLSVAKTQLFVFAVATAAAVLALLLMSMPRLRWWRRGGARRARGQQAGGGYCPAGGGAAAGGGHCGRAAAARRWRPGRRPRWWPGATGSARARPRRTAAAPRCRRPRSAAADAATDADAPTAVLPAQPPPVEPGRYSRRLPSRAAGRRYPPRPRGWRRAELRHGSAWSAGAAANRHISLLSVTYRIQAGRACDISHEHPLADEFEARDTFRSPDDVAAPPLSQADFSGAVSGTSLQQPIVAADRHGPVALTPQPVSAGGYARIVRRSAVVTVDRRRGYGGGVRGFQRCQGLIGAVIGVVSCRRLLRGSASLPWAAQHG